MNDEKEKKLISFNKRATKLISIFNADKRKKGTISSSVNDMVLDEYLPVYADTRKDALYYLDYLCDGAEWRSAKTNDFKTDSNEEKVLLGRKTIAQGIRWLAESRRYIKNKIIFEDILSHLGKEKANAEEAISTDLRESLTYFQGTTGFQCDLTGLYDTAKLILANWEKRCWQEQPSYMILAGCVLYCPVRREFEPQEVFTYLRAFESLYIAENIIY